MIPNTIVTLCIRTEALVPLLERILNVFSAGLVSPRSSEIHLPGREVYRFPWSLDRDVGKFDPLPQSLPGEAVGDSPLTQLGSGEPPTPPNLAAILERIDVFRSRAEQDYKEDRQITDDVLLKFWGPCRIAYLRGGAQREGWFLRQRQPWGELEPICRVCCVLATVPEKELDLSIHIASTIWSHFAWARGQPTRKQDVRAERRNAQILATAITDVVLAYPEAAVEWGIEREHDPDLSGFIPEELQGRLGSSNNFVRVCDTPSGRKDDYRS